MNSAREQALIETRRTRENAERLLASLQDAHASCEAQLASEKRADLVKHVTGKTSLEQAIDETRRMIEVLKRAEAEADRDAGASSAGDSEACTPPAIAGKIPAPHRDSACTGELKPIKPLTAEETEEELSRIAGVLRAAPNSARATVFFSSRTTTRLGALR